MIMVLTTAKSRRREEIISNSLWITTRTSPSKFGATLQGTFSKQTMDERKQLPTRLDQPNGQDGRAT
jgi:hypothetical protein